MNKIITISFAGKQLRIIEIDNGPLFNTRDVLMALGVDPSTIPDHLPQYLTEPQMLQLEDELNGGACA